MIGQVKFIAHKHLLQHYTNKHRNSLPPTVDLRSLPSHSWCTNDCVHRESKIHSTFSLPPHAPPLRVMGVNRGRRCLSCSSGQQRLFLNASAGREKMSSTRDMLSIGEQARLASERMSAHGTHGPGAPAYPGTQRHCWRYTLPSGEVRWSGHEMHTGWRFSTSIPPGEYVAFGQIWHDPDPVSSP